MYIYNRINRFQGGGQPTASFGYKISHQKPFSVIKKRLARVFTPKPICRKFKLKPLTKQNIQFLTELGFKVLEKK